MIVTRFAPSPTGFVHVGSLRTALYSYLLARKLGGRFLLRIEDTDRTRLVEGAVESLLKTLAWSGMDYDEGPIKGGPHAPYVQSERFELYKKAADELLAKGAAYFCFCTSERLDEMRTQQQARKLAPKYDRACLKLPKVEVDRLVAAGTPYVVRLKIPDDRSVMWDDVVRDRVSFESSTIDDQVLMKSDGFPTYHLANVVDDHDMQVTHVIRGEEWLSSTPKHVLLYEAFGWTLPTFAHLPLLLNKDKSKLSKRQGDVAVEDYKNKGYLPEALVNFVALLGWHPGGDSTQEIFSMDELIANFTLEKVHKAGAVFDVEKLDWINWQWRRRNFDAMPGELTEKLLVLAKEYIPSEWFADEVFLKRCLKTVEEKVIKEPKEVPTDIGFYFKELSAINMEVLLNPKMKVDVEMVKRVFEKTLEVIDTLDFTSDETLKTGLVALVTELGLKNGQVFWPLRVALTNEQFSPGVFEVMWALGKERAKVRISKALAGL